MELSHEIEAGLHKNHKTVQKVFWLDYRGTLAHSSSDCDIQEPAHLSYVFSFRECREMGTWCLVYILVLMIASTGPKVNSYQTDTYKVT